MISRDSRTWSTVYSILQCNVQSRYYDTILLGTNSTHSFTHIYLENATYNHRNQTSCERCCIIACNAVRYSYNPETNTGIFANSTFPPSSMRPQFFRSDAKLRSNLARRGAMGPIYLWIKGTVISVYRRGGFCTSPDNEAISSAAPNGNEKWLG